MVNQNEEKIKEPNNCHLIGYYDDTLSSNKISSEVNSAKDNYDTIISNTQA